MPWSYVFHTLLALGILVSIAWVLRNKYTQRTNQIPPDFSIRSAIAIDRTHRIILLDGPETTWVVAITPQNMQLLGTVTLPPKTAVEPLWPVFWQRWQKDQTHE